MKASRWTAVWRTSCLWARSTPTGCSASWVSSSTTRWSLRRPQRMCSRPSWRRRSLSRRRLAGGLATALAPALARGSGSRLGLTARLWRALARHWRGTGAALGAPWAGGRPAPPSAWHAPPLLRAAPPGVLHASGGVELNPEPLTFTLTRRRSATARTSWWCCSTMTSSTLSSCCSSTAGRWPRARSSRRLRAPATGRRCYASQRDESGPSVYGAAAQRPASPRTDRLVLGGAPRTLTRRARARADRRVKAGGCRATATAAACQCSRGSH